MNWELDNNRVFIPLANKTSKDPISYACQLLPGIHGTKEYVRQTSGEICEYTKTFIYNINHANYFLCHHPYHTVFPFYDHFLTLRVYVLLGTTPSLDQGGKNKSVHQGSHTL